MARILSRALVGESQVLVRERHPLFHIRSVAPSSRLLNLRGRSDRSEKIAEIFEVELETDDARRLEDVIYGIVVRRAAPDWLPFLPGSSYWVPPRKRSHGLVELLGRVSSPMTEEDFMSLRSVRGWPCPAHLKGDVSPDSVDKNLKETIVQSEDEDS
ncbi:unnamed protein product [Spirodela intermedia]|uniref:Uncharacterized protein n=1 Tax=Spirodela intermedia TaxID=51605 RepID=A0A7I8JNJ1_SPIIN|nr:unnamed protein product [Spirodela intermedia]CAA6671153.1 unnamed protein product [Spirodela intermedia]